jgi:hypothetical protein
MENILFLEKENINMDNLKLLLLSRIANMGD